MLTLQNHPVVHTKPLTDDSPMSKERNRSRSFRFNLAALIEQVRGVVDSVEVPAAGLCKNKILSFGVKYIALKEICNNIPTEDLIPNINTSALIQGSNCFLAFDSTLEIYYASDNICNVFTEPQVYVMKSSIERYISKPSFELLRDKCTGDRERLSLMLELKRPTKCKKFYLNCKKFTLKTRTIWIGTCDMCSVSLSRVTRYTDNFFLDTHWSLHDLLLDPNTVNDMKVSKLGAVKLMGLLNGYFSIDMDLSDRTIVCKSVTIYSDDNFPTHFCGSVFSFNKKMSHNPLVLNDSLVKQLQEPYPMEYSIDQNHRFMNFTKIFCNYCRFKKGTCPVTEQYIQRLLEPSYSNKLLYDTALLGDLVVLEFLCQCFDELLDIYKSDLPLWRRLGSAIGFTAQDLVITKVESMRPDLDVDQMTTVESVGPDLDEDQMCEINVIN